MRILPVLLLAACSSTPTLEKVLSDAALHLPFEGDSVDVVSGESAESTGDFGYTDGVVGSAADFSGAPMILAPAGLPPLGDSSLAFWIHTVHPEITMDVMSQRETCTWGRFVEIRMQADGVLRTTFMNGSSDWEDASSYKSLDISVPASTWTHIALTFEDDGNGTRTGRAYLDGIEVDSVELEEDFRAAPMPLVVNGNPCIADLLPFTGRLDEIVISERVYSPEEVGLLATR